ncbi:MAG TPA: PD-(D/E)XK nuclease family protein [Haliangiales bacterium]|nr:PD-(D/E)XK nuclease family protein [Haliangiales bacterium]
MPSIAALRHAPWSLSKIQCALRCAREFHYRYVERVAEPEVAPETRIGKAVHAVLEAALARAPLADALAAGRRELMSDEERARFAELGVGVDKFLVRIDGLRRRRRVRAELIEHRLALSFDLSPTDFVAKDAFFRGVWDAAFLFEDGVCAVVDHKTGARRGVADYADQLKGYAVLAAKHLEVEKVWLGVHFVADAAMEWTPPASRREVEGAFAPRLLATIEDAAGHVAGSAPQPSTWCRRCSYKSICPAMRAAAAELPEPAPELVDDVLKEG